MKKTYFYIAVTFLSIMFFSFYDSAPKNSSSVILQFVTVNGYGNNLYLDNIKFGVREPNDISVTSLNNIKKDTTFTIGNGITTIAPEINVTNLGLNTVDSFYVTFIIKELLYSKTDTLRHMTSGQTTTIIFDSVVIPVNFPVNIQAYTTYALDTNRSNDTLNQYSIFLQGAQRNIMLEEFTNTNSPSCAGNDPSLNSFIDTNFQSVCAVRYHTSFPSPMNDSMYLANSLQSDQRTNYYFVTSVPNLFFDGKLRAPLPFSLDSNLIIPFNSRIKEGSPLSLSVTDTHIAGDSIYTNINLNLLYNLSPGNYKLKIFAVERNVVYANPPGLNGQKNFYDVFRKMYPDSNGIPIQITAGSYQFSYTYARESNWIDSMIYTVAFVQNDNTKEILNSGKARNYHRISPNSKNSNNIFRKADAIGKSNFKSQIYHITNSDTGSFSSYLEIFEGGFPPPGWTVYNPDISISFEKVTGYNGPTLGGTSSMRVPFYEYPFIGQKDTILSKTFNNVYSSDTLSFDYSYAQYLSSFVDSLIVNASTDGGATFINIFRKGGYALSTAPATTLSFGPNSTTEWSTFYYPMSNLIPQNAPSQNLPANYKLYQNYPNPFNPNTTIKFELPHNNIVTIKVYDILGREVAQLVNEKMNAGIHEIVFDGSRYASGIYFCQMISGDYIQVKKMLMIK